MPEPPDEPDRLDELFTVTPQEFVARRNELVKALRRERRRDEAKEVAALRRPTAPLWALNQLARRHPEEVAELLEAGADLPAAQDALLAGDQDRFRTAVARHRQLVSRLAGLGVRLVTEAGVSATDQRQDIAAELHAASTVAEAAEPFRLGRLTDRPGELGEPVTGLSGGGFALAPAAPARPGRAAADRAGGGPSTGRSARPATAAADEPHNGRADDHDVQDQAEQDRAEQDRAEQARAEEERAEARRAAEAAVTAAGEAARRARDEHRALAGEVADLEADLARARRRLRSAAERLGEREDQLAEAEQALGDLG